MAKEPNISKLKDQGKISKLVKLLKDKDPAIKRKAAAALTEIPKAIGNQRVIKALQKQISKELNKKTRPYFPSPVDHPSVITLKSAEGIIKQISKIEYLACIKGAWENAYIDFLKDHQEFYKSVFKLSLDRDRARKAWGEQAAKQSVKLANQHLEISAPPKVMGEMVIFLKKQVDFFNGLTQYGGGMKFLQISPLHDDPHDWDKSRYVYHEYFKMTEKYSGMKFKLDLPELKRFANNFAVNVITTGNDIMKMEFSKSQMKEWGKWSGPGSKIIW